MRLLLDTHIFLAAIGSGATDLPTTAAALLKREDAELHLSAASLWEIAIKHRLGKLGLAAELRVLPELLNDLGIRIVPIDARHALATVASEPPTRDPFDRMLLAQCQVEGFRLVTVDRALVSHPLAVPAGSSGD